jgi:raffinose/stachyose/melibiose transport system permease protein
MVLNSFRTKDEITRLLIGWPTTWTFSNYIDVWIKGGYAKAFQNSLIVGTVTVLIVLLVNSLACYAITRLDIYGSSFFTGYFVAALSIPAFAILVPLYFMFQKVGLVNSLFGLIIIYSAKFIPFNFLFMRAFFIGIPRELEQAAKIDGCSEAGTLLRITLPLAKPIMTTVALIVFTNSWNEFLFANTFLVKSTLRTAPLKFYNFVSEFEANFAYVFTAGIITMLPIVFIYLLLQKSFIEGMTQGGLKG